MKSFLSFCEELSRVFEEFEVSETINKSPLFTNKEGYYPAIFGKYPFCGVITYAIENETSSHLQLYGTKVVQKFKELFIQEKQTSPDVFKKLKDTYIFKLIVDTLNPRYTTTKAFSQILDVTEIKPIIDFIKANAYKASLPDLVVVESNLHRINNLSFPLNRCISCNALVDTSLLRRSSKVLPFELHKKDNAIVCPFCSKITENDKITNMDELLMQEIEVIEDSSLEFVGDVRKQAGKKVLFFEVTKPDTLNFQVISNVTEKTLKKLPILGSKLKPVTFVVDLTKHPKLYFNELAEVAHAFSELLGHVENKIMHTYTAAMYLQGNGTNFVDVDRFNDAILSTVDALPYEPYSFFINEEITSPLTLLKNTPLTSMLMHKENKLKIFNPAVITVDKTRARAFIKNMNNTKFEYYARSRRIIMLDIDLRLEDMVKNYKIYIPLLSRNISEYLGNLLNPDEELGTILGKFCEDPDNQDNRRKAFDIIASALIDEECDSFSNYICTTSSGAESRQEHFIAVSAYSRQNKSSTSKPSYNFTTMVLLYALLYHRAELVNVSLLAENLSAVLERAKDSIDRLSYLVYPPVIIDTESSNISLLKSSFSHKQLSKLSR